MSITRKEFFNRIKEELETESLITSQTSFKDIPEYDSLGILSIISLIDEYFDVTLSGEDFKTFSTLDDLVKTIGASRFES